MLKPFIQAVIDGQTLARAEAVQAMATIMNGEASPAQIGSFLTALRMRGETDEELAGFAQVMRAKAVRVHGNRAMTSRCGSADVLEALGVRIELAPEQVAECVERVGIAFMYAPAFHPAMRFAGPVRREIGIRTVFNLLGPLVNPAGARHQVIGVPTTEAASRLARVLGLLGAQHALVVHAHAGLDELGVSGPSTIAEMLLRESAWVTTYEVTPEQYDLERFPPEAIRGGSVSDNVGIATRVLSGEPGAARAITLLNAGAALYAADATPTIAGGVRLAAESIDSGAARAKLAELVSLTARMTIAEKAVA